MRVSLISGCSESKMCVTGTTSLLRSIVQHCTFPLAQAVAVLYLILSRCSRAGLWLWVLLSAALVGICKMAYPSTDLNTSNDRTETRTIICDEVMSCGKVNVFCPLGHAGLTTSVSDRATVVD